MDDVRARHLSQCHVQHWNVRCETLENATCEGVLSTSSDVVSQVMSLVGLLLFLFGSVSL